MLVFILNVPIFASESSALDNELKSAFLPVYLSVTTFHFPTFAICLHIFLSHNKVRNFCTSSTSVLITNQSVSAGKTVLFTEILHASSICSL